MELSGKRWGAQQLEIAKLVLLHGMGGTGSLWRPVAAGLEDDFAILAPDQRGHGGSLTDRPIRPENFTPQCYAEDVAETLQAQQFSPAFVVGHSMGGRTAAALAHIAPELVQGLVLVDIGLHGPAGGGLGRPLGDFLKKMPMEFPSRADARVYMDRECPDPSIGQYLMAVSVPKADGGQTFPFDRDALIATIEAAERAELRPWIREAAGRGLPILILHGETSRVWLKKDFEAEREAFADLPGVVFESWDGTGHGLPFEKRMQFVARLRDFMTGRR